MNPITLAANTTTTTGGLNNASSAISGGMNNSFELFSLSVIVLGVTIFGVFVISHFAPWIAQNRLLFTIAQTIGTAVGYAIKGIMTVAAASVIAVPAYYLATADGSTQAAIGKWVGIGTAAFLVLVVIGIVADRAVTRYVEAHPDADEFADLQPESPQEQPEGSENA